VKPDNGNFTVSGHHYDAVAKFWCLPGYEMAGNDTATCQQTGNWSSLQPNCLSISGHQPSFHTFVVIVVVVVVVLRIGCMKHNH